MGYLNKFWRFVNDYSKIILVVCIVLILAVASGTSAYFLYKEKKTKPLALTSTGQLSVCSESKAIDLVKPNVVKVENKTKSKTTTGTGFFEPTGYLITNSHIVDEKGDITVFYPDQSSSKAILVSNDTYKDIAILSVEKSSVKSLNWANTTDLEEPDTLMAIGYALNLPGESSVTKGAYSAKRDAEGLNYIQTDTALNPGNSGGPLINVCGQIVGINSFAAENATIGLALSSESSQNIVKNLTQNPKINYFNGGTRSTVISNLLQAIGNTEFKVEDAEKASTEQNKNAATSAATSRSSSSSSKKPAINPDYVNCDKNITLSSVKTTVEKNEKAHLYYPAYSSITWSSEGGTLSDKTNTGAQWSHSVPGTYNITASFANRAGTVCSSNLRVTVLSPLSRIEGLAKIVAYFLPSSYDSASNSDYSGILISYRNAAGSDLSYANRSFSLPISAKVTIYKANPDTNDNERVIFQKNYTNDEISGNYALQGRIIKIPGGSLDLNDSDYTNNETYIKTATTIYTPEQSSFSFSDESYYVLKK